MSTSADEKLLARYGLLASALAGTELTVLLGDERAARTFSDGAAVFVPAARLDEAWLDVSLQALLVRSGTLAPEALRRMYARPERARSYLGFELARAVASFGALLPRRVCEHPALAALPAATGDLEQSIARARRVARSLGDTPAAWGVLLPGRVLKTQRRQGGTPTQAVEAAVKRSPRDESELETSRLLARFRAPFASSVGLLGKLMAKLLDMQPSPGGPAQGGAAGEELEVVGTSEHTGGVRVAVAARTVELGAPPPRGVRLYPEWDARRGRYLRDWVHVAEVAPDPDNAPETPLLPGREGAHALRKALRRLCLGYEPRAHQREGDDVRIDELVRLRIAALSGHVADERIYRATLRTRRDLGVLILLDITGSTGERAQDGVSVFERQLALALSLTEALHEAGDRVACYGFHSWGRKLVRLQRLLAFGERPDARLRRRAAWLSPVGYSRLGAAVRHGTTILQRDAGMPYRLLVVISDGVAYDQGYEADYARADTRRALHEAQAAATACVCLSVGAEVDPARHDEVFGGAHYLAIPQLAGHERALSLLFEQAVARVSRRRRLGQPASK